MHLWRPWVHYSDQPVPGAEKIVTSAPTSNGIGGAACERPAESRRRSRGPWTYTEFSIDSPAKEQTFFGDEIIPFA
jgi:hypothetical protein